ncbi:MAG TPA: hypothetical protein VD816_14525 [Ohtaekwangia sp.]|nr:hypothetical protein [Ohtaekwangia sp.]
MREILNVTTKVFVREFYRENASLFMLVFGLAAGFMRGQDHVALGESFIASPHLMLIPGLIWLGYTLRVMNFNHQALRRKENEFVFQLNIFSRFSQRMSVAITTFYQLLPVYGYGVFLVALSVKYARYGIPGLIFIVIAGLHLMVNYQFAAALRQPNRARKQWRLTRLLDQHTIRPYPLVLVEWVVRRQALLIIGLKSAAFLMLFGSLRLYYYEAYDHRLLAMAIAVTMAIPVVITTAMHRFENFHFSILRQLPLAMVKRMTYVLTAIALLSLPEIALLLKYFPEHLGWMTFAASVLFAVSIPFLFYSLQYTEDRKEEKFMRLVFAWTIAWIVLVLFKVPIWALAGGNLLIAARVWRKFYYVFEYTTPIADD